MAIEIQLSRPVNSDPAAADLVETLRNESAPLGLDHAILYYGYPRYRDDDDELIAAQILVMSPNHGITIFGTLNSARPSADEKRAAEQAAESVLALLHSKLLANKALRSSPIGLRFPVKGYIYSPNLRDVVQATDDLEYLNSHALVRKVLSNFSLVEDAVFAQLTASIDGTRSIPRPKKRSLDDLPSDSKGTLVARLEAELARFDVKQREGSVTTITGPQRIRGLAGSGKTIVLTRKAALAHLDDPSASIAYTFHTKSLYQQIRRLITRFYRSEYDRDPDWNQVRVLHSWGGGDPGIYSLACARHGISPLSFAEARGGDPASPFRYACRVLLESVSIHPMYDYIFIDEGQDFPPEFVKLCSLLARDTRFVYAYDDLQSIFQTRAPDSAAIFGINDDGSPKTQFERDIVLYKCYRNPREILVCAHAIGFGLYGKPVQMLENEEHWRDVGYEVIQGPLEAGRDVTILRPPENSVPLLSDAQTVDQLIETKVYSSMEEEIDGVTEAVLEQIRNGLRADDIVIAVVDDRHARRYLNSIAYELSQNEIACNNIHEAYGVPEFQVEGRVTLTTVHKAKGNEGFAVHVVGADAVFQYPSKGNRNRLFTAMTRAKGWLRVTGVGAAAKRLAKEIQLAKKNSPCLRFQYPSAADLETMKRDLGREAALTMEQERLLDEIPEDKLSEYLKKRRKPPKRK
ncbi:MAG: DEAD/DEAH box helicase [Acidobacteriaceae bacterium]|nr:DEAD/DEAH box helicase [Acidobacteriaceae bacterium]